ncbi:hypothetical protein FOMPIDRAFT_159068 [Fomitopsis schrenkii]|uniref:Uncharacterized protein n=1 Tax=Fomitopsis schrenkii TaxID=2126942 RepID=S8G510_FOMSC|nr:hypothetical protein FOMPIDRAFT_159068 [Fomitopsis schrenkii]
MLSNGPALGLSALGSFFIGRTIASVLYGCLSGQFIFYIGSYFSRDNNTTRSSVICLWLLETLLMVMGVDVCPFPMRGSTTAHSNMAREIGTMWSQIMAIWCLHCRDSQRPSISSCLPLHLLCGVLIS